MLKPSPLVLVLLATTLPAVAANSTCVTPKDALRHIGKDVCVTAHIYRVVDAGEGAHFLDVCSPQTTDADCHFFILSFSHDETSIAYLHGLVGQEIHIRGTVHTMQNHAEITLSDPRQLHGDKGRFQPNPRLAHGFSAENKYHAFRPSNGTLGQRGVHFYHRGK